MKLCYPPVASAPPTSALLASIAQRCEAPLGALTALDSNTNMLARALLERQIIYMRIRVSDKRSFNSSKVIAKPSQLIGLPLGHQAPEILSEPVPTDLGRKANG